MKKKSQDAGEGKAKRNGEKDRDPVLRAPGLSLPAHYHLPLETKSPYCLSEVSSATAMKSILGDTSDPLFFTAELENLK